MAETTPDGIWSPDNTNFFDWVAHFGAMAQSVQDALTGLREEIALPAPVQVYNAANNALVTSTTIGADAPSAPTATLTLEKPCWVLVNAGCWASSADGAEIRVGVKVSGATAIAPSAPTWGQVERYHPGATAGKASINKLVRLEAGNNTVTFSAWKVADTGFASISYMILDIMPLRWDS